MQGLSGTLLALALVFLSLISLLSANRSWEDSFVKLDENESKVSELGLRFNMQR